MEAKALEDAREDEGASCWCREGMSRAHSDLEKFTGSTECGAVSLLPLSKSPIDEVVELLRIVKFAEKVVTK